MVAAGRMVAKIGGVGLQIAFATGCCASTPADRTGWSMGSDPGAPSKLTPIIPPKHWRRLLRPARSRRSTWRRARRRKDLARWLLETFAISLDETTVGRELKALGFAKISARPRHYAQNSWPRRGFSPRSMP